MPKKRPQKSKIRSETLSREEFRKRTEGLGERMEKRRKARIRKLQKEGIPISGKLNLAEVISIGVVTKRIKNAQESAGGKKVIDILKENKARITSVKFAIDSNTTILYTSKGTDLAPLKIMINGKNVSIQEIKK